MIVLDPTLAEFYREVNKYWRDHENTTLNHVTLVSTGGGDKDIQVREGLTPLDGVSTCLKWPLKNRQNKGLKDKW